MTLGFTLPILALILPATTADPVASDYFPLSPGLRATYSDSAIKGALILHEVQPAMKVADQTVFPVFTFQDGVKSDVGYYIASRAEITIVSYDGKKLLADAHPLFKVGDGKVEWAYKGATSIGKTEVPLEIKGESYRGGRRKVLGKSVETLIVKLEVTVDSGPGTLKDKQDMVFAKGIGLVEMNEAVTMSGRTQSHVVKLVSFDDGSIKS